MGWIRITKEKPCPLCGRTKFCMRNDNWSAVQWHDCAERWLGDIPAPAKWSNPELTAALNLLRKMIEEVSK